VRAPNRTDLTGTQLRAMIDYDAMTGAMTWRIRKARWIVVGEEAGHVVKKTGYRVIGINGSTYLAQRLAWLHITDEWPKGEIDHRDGDKVNNRFSNLRDVSGRVNRHNVTKARSHNATGILGVHMKRPGTWTAHISLNGKDIHLGTFNSPELASAAYVAAKRRMHEGCTL
jgi:hypothetical protein